MKEIKYASNGDEPGKSFGERLIEAMFRDSLLYFIWCEQGSIFVFPAKFNLLQHFAALLGKLPPFPLSDKSCM
jgi:hypothetical protein